MKRKTALLCLIFLSALALTAEADSCPYCGKSYGDAAPGDESRVYALRSAHEASCGASSSGSSSYGGGGYSNWEYQQQLQQQRIWEEQERIRQEQERIRREQERRRKRLETEAAAEKAREEEMRREWDAKKTGLSRSLKGVSTGKLTMKTSVAGGGVKLRPKGSDTLNVKIKKDAAETAAPTEPAASDEDLFMQASKMEEYYKTLKVVDVPLPSNSGSKVTRRELVEEGLSEISDEADRARDSAKSGIGKSVDWVIRKKREAVDWVYQRTFDETFNQIPIVRGLRSFTQKTGTWYKGMREISVGIFEHDMDMIRRGIAETGNGVIYTDGGDDGAEWIGSKTRERAGKMASDELEGKGIF